MNKSCLIYNPAGALKNQGFLFVNADPRATQQHRLTALNGEVMALELRIGLEAPLNAGLAVLNAGHGTSVLEQNVQELSGVVACHGAFPTR